MKSHHTSIIPRRVSQCLLICSLAPAVAVAATGSDTNPFWSSILTLLVMAAAACSAVLPISALRYWKGYWKLVAAIPLLALAGWSSWIMIARLLQPTAHSYWLMEIFAWAMLAMLYMATMMLAKRKIEKADNPENN